MKAMNLNIGWHVLEAPLEWGITDYPKVATHKDGWYDCNLPADVRVPLIENGVIQDPIVGENSFDSEWIEKRSWWFTKEFDADSLNLQADLVELVMDRLDSNSDIFVNDQYIGHHNSVHYPFRRNIKEQLKEGKNTITVRLTTGMEQVTDEQVAELSYAVCTESDNGGWGRGDKRRSFVRRPQFTVGWDWGPKVVTVGMAGDVNITCYTNIAIREVKLNTTGIDGSAQVSALINVEDLNLIASASADVTVELSFAGKVVAKSSIKKVLITSGYNYVETKLAIRDPKLWWPAGYGDQPMYDVKVSACCHGVETQFPSFRYGIRTIRLDTSVIHGEDRRFELIVNNVPIYCKGGNWIPADMIYSRVTKEKLEILIDEAIAANFNMMRVWGGGLYEQDAFYELCDSRGILLWHDFMLCCSTYPDHHRWFCDEVRREFDYQTKRLRNHSCLALFCGTNEVHWIFNSYDNPRWKISILHEKQYGLSLPNELAKEVIHNNCPQIPFWNSSPYGGELPNSDTVGDVHRWHNALMSLKMEDRIEVKDFDNVACKFMSEYGYLGPCCEESTLAYLGTDAIERSSKNWQWHLNVFERDTVCAGIEKNYGIDAKTLTNDQYLLYGGLVHGLMLGYSLEAIRFKDFCGGGLFWMYDDAWGEVGWTIIDYYLKRKIPYYAVKRALAHKKLTMRTVDCELVVQGMNDTPEAIQFQAEFGYVSFDGKTRSTKTIDVVLPARSRAYILRMPLPDADYTKGSIVLIPSTDTVDAIYLRTDDVRKMQYEQTQLKVEQKDDGEDRVVTLSADSFVHSVYIKGNYNCTDNYFDLLPGQKRTVIVHGAAGSELEIERVR
jgi:beta-mannosidase